MTRKQADKVNTLPGLTFPIFFNHYSGYLQGKDSDYLHYWLLESQGNPATDPLILWLVNCNLLLHSWAEGGKEVFTGCKAQLAEVAWQAYSLATVHST